MVNGTGDSDCPLTAQAPLESKATTTANSLIVMSLESRFRYFLNSSFARPRGAPRPVRGRTSCRHSSPGHREGRHRHRPTRRVARFVGTRKGPASPSCDPHGTRSSSETPGSSRSPWSFSRTYLLPLHTGTDRRHDSRDSESASRFLLDRLRSGRVDAGCGDDLAVLPRFSNLTSLAPRQEKRGKIRDAAGKLAPKLYRDAQIRLTRSTGWEMRHRMTDVRRHQGARTLWPA